MKMILFLFFAMSCLTAGPLITYSFTGVATGTIGGNAFNNASISVSATADSAGVICAAGTCRLDLPGGGAGFSIGGIGSGTFSGTTYFFDNQTSSVAGFGDLTAPVNCCDIIQLDNVIFGTYDLGSALGPIGPAASNPSVGDWIDLNTSLGAFTVTSMTNYSFLATVADVPEPSTFFLVIAGAGLVVIGRSRRTDR